MNRISFETDKFFTGNLDTGLPDAGVWQVRSTHYAIDVQMKFDAISVSIVDSVSLNGEEGFYFHVETEFFKTSSPMNKRSDVLRHIRDRILQSGDLFHSIGCDPFYCANSLEDFYDKMVLFSPSMDKRSQLIDSFLRALSLRKVFAKSNPTLKAQFDASVIEDDPATGLKSLLMHPDRLEYGNTGVLSAMMAVNCAYRWETRAGVGR